MVITIIVVVINLATIIVVIIRFDWDQVVTWEISGRGAGHKLLSRRTSFEDDDDDYHDDHNEDAKDSDCIRRAWNDFECFGLY